MKFSHHTFKLKSKEDYPSINNNSSNLFLDFSNTWGDIKYYVKISPRCGSSLLKHLYNRQNNIKSIEDLYIFIQTKKKFNLNSNKLPGDGRKVLIKRDPIGKWISAVNIYKGRFGSIMDKKYHRGLKDKNIEPWLINDFYFWKDVDPNDMVKFHFRPDSQLRKVSEFTSQYLTNGSISNYDEVYDISELDELLLKLYNETGLNISYDENLKNSRKKTKVNMNLIDYDDLTEKTVSKLKSLYKLDYINGY